MVEHTYGEINVTYAKILAGLSFMNSISPFSVYYILLPENTENVNNVERLERRFKTLTHATVNKVLSDELGESCTFIAIQT